MGTNSNEKPDKANLIIEAAQRRFGLYGVEKTSMREIAGDLKMTKGSLYYYFPDKENLYQAVIEKEQSEFLEKLKEDSQSAADNSAWLNSYVVKRLIYFRALLNLARIRQESLSDIPPLVRQSLNSFREKEKEIIMEVFEKGNVSGEFNISDPAGTALLFLDLLRGIRSAVFSRKSTLMIDEEEYNQLLKKTVDFTEIFTKGLRYR
jgi:AcrR family transcriptional regulator